MGYEVKTTALWKSTLWRQRKKKERKALRRKEAKRERVRGSLVSFGHDVASHSVNSGPLIGAGTPSAACRLRCELETFSENVVLGNCIYLSIVFILWNKYYFFKYQYGHGLFRKDSLMLGKIHDLTKAVDEVSTTVEPILDWKPQLKTQPNWLGIRKYNPAQPIGLINSIQQFFQPPKTP